MESNQNMQALLEAILFSQGKPVKTQFLAQLTEQSEAQTELYLTALQGKYAAAESGIQLLKSGDSWVLTTKAIYAAYIGQALELSRQVPLSRSAMEVLSIIAYKQPISRGYIDSIRGVDSAHLVHTLLEKELIEEAGRLDVPGRPILYRTTELFLRSFQLQDLSDLPPLPEEYEQLEFMGEETEGALYEEYSEYGETLSETASKV